MPAPDASGAISAVLLPTGVPSVDALINGFKWSSSTITYSFPVSGSYWSTSTSAGYGPSSGDGEPWSRYLDFFSASDAARFRAALQQWANVAGLTFKETADTAGSVGDIRVAYSWTQATSSAEAWAYTPDGTPLGGDIWVNTKTDAHHSPFAEGSYPYMTLLHELGHALGLKHPFESETSNPAVIDSAHDSLIYTLMSYSAAPGQQGTYLSYYPTTPMLYDIQAIQSLYGKNMSYNAGDNVYAFKDGSTYLQTIWDAGGNNTISYSGTKAATIDLREGHGSTLGNDVYVLDSAGNRLNTVPNVWIAYGTSIRNAIGGSGNNTLIANDAGDMLTGGPANNTIIGGAGNDTIVISGTGTNTIDGGAGLDTLILGGARNGFTLARTNSANSADSGVTITAVGAQGTETLANLERIRFSDKAIALDTGGAGGEAYRMYQAAFDRAPDLGGLGYWIDKLDKGSSLVDVAAGFFNSPEFKGLYGDHPSDADLITRLYQNVLHRAPDTSGFAYWMDELQSGRQTPTIALMHFSESPENQAQLIGTIQGGMEYLPVA